ncbi:hypothetical protein SAMN02745910_04275 [Priestia endophytica DSM 13796]|uniref:Uncharacterized protein n=1 Tax=Priestia endophytica DSM 13796 TaxID=1121089 RepID=A0A1I6BV25_9BACI|nr:hypothetical protein SAMN02745910_04275 [Priestia endophytica DSM 13796]
MMFAIEAIIGYVCFFILNFVVDKFFNKQKASFGRLSIISLIQTIIAIIIYVII